MYREEELSDAIHQDIQKEGHRDVLSDDADGVKRL